jgi:hypothetical protein
MAATLIRPTPQRIPVLLLIFNRPESTAAVMESLRTIKPPALYIAADGPRPHLIGEAEKCAEARRVALNVEWDCEVRTLFRDQNLGCGRAVSGGISWFFEHVNEGIVLEDDCVPSASFYPFCQQLLSLYRDEPRVMHISGNSHQYGRRRGAASYYFSEYANMWGWATWRRAWKAYDFGLRPAWELDDTWDTQWQLSIEKSHGLAIVPNVNLVQNIGFGSGATHTKSRERPASLGAAEMAFPLAHPASLAPDHAADVFTYYAHHRMVRHLRLIWLYRLMDWAYARLKPIKRRIFNRW